jgi:hypothetical protein
MQPSVKLIEKMANDPSMIQAAKTVFEAMAYEQTIRPIVEEYQTKVLAEINGVNQYTGKPVTEPKHAYNLNDADFQIYCTRINEERIKAGFQVPDPDHCPLLIAESMVRDAKHILIETAAPFTFIALDSVMSSLEAYEQLVDLTLKLMANKTK